jgi:nitrilase
MLPSISFSSILLTTQLDMDKTVRVGAVQAEPVWFDLDGGVDKTISLIEEAASDGVQVLGFPEVWIPGYPW